MGNLSTLHKRTTCDCGQPTGVNPETGDFYKVGHEAICERCWRADVKSAGAQIKRGRKDRLIENPQQTASPLLEWYNVPTWHQTKTRSVAA